MPQRRSRLPWLRQSRRRATTEAGCRTFAGSGSWVTRPSWVLPVGDAHHPTPMARLLPSRRKYSPCDPRWYPIDGYHLPVIQLLSALGIDPAWRGPAMILLIAIVALVTWYALRFGAGQVAGRVLARQPPDAEAVLPQVELERRVRTLERTAVRTGGVVIVIVAVLMALSSGFQVDIGPAVAGLGIVGIAVGFGAQTLIRDWLG